MAGQSVTSFVRRDLEPRAVPTLSSLTPPQASKGEPDPTLSTQLNFRRPNIEVIAFNRRHSKFGNREYEGDSQ